MLIEFTVKNFRSIRDEFTFSMVATKDQTLRDKNVVDLKLPSVPPLLRFAAIYGANASGKSNLVLAMGYFKDMLRPEFQVDAPNSVYAPFLLDKISESEPSEFEVIFVKNGIRYQFGCAIQKNEAKNEYEFIEEWLYVTPKNRIQSWYKRNRQTFEFGASFRGQKKVWQNATNPNRLFLTTAIQLNSTELKPIADWFNEEFFTILRPHRIPYQTVQKIKSEENRQQVVRLLQKAGIAVSDLECSEKFISVEPTFFPKVRNTTENVSEGAFELLVTQSYKLNHEEMRFYHSNQQGSFPLTYDMQSVGTQHYFGLIGQLLLTPPTVTTIADELDASLHPLLLKNLIESFQNSAGSDCQTQLIFTTHNSHILTDKLLRRDQVWFMQSDRDLASNLIPLSDFHPRKDQAMEKSYLEGRFGGIPILG